MKNYFKLTIIMLVVCASLVSVALPAMAGTMRGDIKGKLDDLAIEMGQDPTAAIALEDSIGQIIKLALGFVGVVVVIIMIYAGFLWMTAGGNEDQVKKAKAWMTNAVIGLVIVLAAYAISDFAIKTILDATGQ
mgnify:CR=1 FL=1